MTTLLPPDQPLLLAAAILLLIAGAILAETHSRIGKIFTAPALILVLGALASNSGFMPLSAPLYDGIFIYLVPVAIPLLLLKADLRRMLRETGTMMIIFLVGSVYVVLATLLGVFLLDLGPEEAKVAGTLSATFIGGSMNFVAVSNALDFADKNLVAAALAADNVIGVSYLILLSTMTGTALFQQFIKTPAGVSAVTETAAASRDELRLSDLAVALAASVAVVALATFIAGGLGLPRYSILLVTILAVALANIFPRGLQRLRGDFELGTLFMYIFFFVIGASTDLRVFFNSALTVALFAVIIISLHALLIFGTARLFKWDFAETAVASNAVIAGPATAAALAASRGWTHLVTPGVLCGVFGYVIANFIGIGLARLLAP